MICYRCTHCDELHEGIPVLYLEWPDYILDEGAELLVAKEDDAFCEWNGHYFVRCTLELPVPEADDVVEFSLWASVSADSYATLRDLDQPFTGCFAWLANYPDWVDFVPANIACDLHWRDDDHPLLVLHPRSDAHPLWEAYHTGLTMQQVLDRMHDLEVTTT